MQLTAKQEQGLRCAVSRFEAGDPYTCIAGFAGSGKSTLIKFIVAALKLDPEKVAYVAYTGKAAQVLAQKGCPNATTAHKLLYSAKPMPNGRYYFKEKDVLDKDYKLLVVDEVSMLPVAMWKLLLSHKVHVIACGDPEQLPCLISAEDNHVLDSPHIFLDEIMRQAQENEIIRLSMWIREGRSLKSFQTSNKEVMILSPREVHLGMYRWADQILCAKNDTRNQINAEMRKALGYGESPVPGDKIICCHNQWDFFSKELDEEKRVPLTNGTIGYINDCIFKPQQVPYYISHNEIPVLYTSMTDETGHIFQKMNIDYNCLLKGKKYLTPQQEYKMMINKKCPPPPIEFAYGYAITTWKAQGSEWDKVLGFEERFPLEREEHRRFLYTMITRAKEKLVIVTKN